MGPRESDDLVVQLAMDETVWFPMERVTLRMFLRCKTGVLLLSIFGYPYHFSAFRVLLDEGAAIRIACRMIWDRL